MNAAQLINQTSGETDFWSPPELIESAREVMRGIVLDPATSKAANKVVQAEHIFTAPEAEVIGEMDGFKTIKDGKKSILVPDRLPLIKNKGKGGLGSPWKARTVWLNHPFHGGESKCRKGCKKLVCRKRGYHIAHEIPSNSDWVDYVLREHHEQRTQSLIMICYAVTSEKWFAPLLGRPQCFLTPRTNYYTPDGKLMKGSTKGSVITYFGKDVPRFASCFHKHGVVKVAL